MHKRQFIVFATLQAVNT